MEKFSDVEIGNMGENLTNRRYSKDLSFYFQRITSKWRNEDSDLFSTGPDPHSEWDQVYQESIL